MAKRRQAKVLFFRNITRNLGNSNSSVNSNSSGKPSDFINPRYSCNLRSTGYISLLILLLLTTFSGLGMEVYLKANAENRMVRRENQSRQALYAAEGGVEWAKAHLRVNSGLRRGSVSLSTGRVDVVIETTNGGGYKVTSQGYSGLAVRKIQVVLQLVTGKWIINTYQELHT